MTHPAPHPVQPQNATATTVAALFEDRCAATPDALAFLAPEDLAASTTTWVEHTYREFHDEVHAVAAGLLSLGVASEERVAIASTTRYAWIVASMGVMCSGATITSIYPNSTEHDELFVLTDSGTKILIAENQAQVAKVQAHDEELYEQVRHIVLIDDDRQAADRVDRRVITWAELQQRGRDHLAAHPDAVTRAEDALTADSLAILIYTSGTTGRPKGVELTHRSLVSVAHALTATGVVTAEDLQYLWLPLSHVFGNCLLAVQWVVGFATAVDGRIDRIVAGFGEVRPTIVCGVPRIFEKIRAGVITRSPAGGLQGRIMRWAFATGREAVPYLVAGEPLPRGLARRYALADRLVFRKLHEAMGGRLRLFISGSAKISQQVLEWFFAAGIPIIEGYGSTETTISALNPPQRPRLGSIGPAVPGMEVRLAEDGELLMKGPLLMRGYHGRPEATAAVMEDGWFHTGDIARIDDEGYIYIVDRKKDMLKTSSGKYVAPQKVEGMVMANVPYLSSALAFGDGRKYVVALVTMDRDALLAWARKRDLGAMSYEELTQHPDIRASVDKLMDRANAKLERWETVKRYVILDHELTLEDGTMTASAKARRAVIAQRYAHIIDTMYEPE